MGAARLAPVAIFATLVTAGAGAGDASAVTITPGSNTVTASRIAMAFGASDPNDPERVTSLKWTDSDGVQTGNLAASGGSTCNEPIEFFGQSYGGAGGLVV